MNTNIPFPVRHGKVRDIYEINDQELVMVASDRVSAFDQVLGTLIPGRGKILHEFDMFWANKLNVDYHCITDDVNQMPKQFQTEGFEGRTMLVQKLEVIPFECIVRAFLTGSAWKEYQKSGTVHGMKLPKGLQPNTPFPEPIFTPSTKAPAGQHDENITIEQMEKALGRETFWLLHDRTLDIFNDAYKIAFEKGVIIADTKFEWGHDNGQLILIDEIMTPDSSRFWPVENYRCPGVIESIDKQYIRDYLDMWWDHKTPNPTLPDNVRDHVLVKYREALRRIISE
jgi:phosphoribosylaminoimidazole-succinocarboxamide synthase